MLSIVYEADFCSFQFYSKVSGAFRIIQFICFVNCYIYPQETEEDNEKNKRSGYCVLSLEYKTKKYETQHLSIKRFKPSEIDKANDYYNELESQKSNTKSDNVLVRVSSFSELKKAYPNYFSDISEFVALIKRYLR